MVPKSERSRFVERAVDDALKVAARDRALEALEKVKGLSSGGENSTDYIRRKRLEWDGRPIDVLEGRKR